VHRSDNIIDHAETLCVPTENHHHYVPLRPDVVWLGVDSGSGPPLCLNGYPNDWTTRTEVALVGIEPRTPREGQAYREDGAFNRENTSFP
jgi:hypothetical protein